MSKPLSQIAYEAYGDQVGWVNHLGKPMPQWADLPGSIQGGWGAAVGATAIEIARGLGRAMSGNPE